MQSHRARPHDLGPATAGSWCRRGVRALSALAFRAAMVSPFLAVRIAVRDDAGRACQLAGVAGASGRHGDRVRVPESGRSCRPPEHAAVCQACRRVGGRRRPSSGGLRHAFASPHQGRSRTPCATWAWTSKTRSPSLKVLRSDHDGSLHLRGAGRLRAQPQPFRRSPSAPESCPSFTVVSRCRGGKAGCVGTLICHRQT